jgi:DnaJ-class molecular chaperone
MAEKDLYTVLGVPKGSNEKEIKQAYRRLAREYHPDVNPGDKEAEARFKEINAAHEVLGDTENRAKYDKYGEQWQHADQIEAMQERRGGQAFRFGGDGGIHFQSGSGGTMDDLGGIFGSIFTRQSRGARRGADIEQQVEISLNEAFHGTTRTLQFAGQERCTTCDGSGEIAGAGCHVCQGSGLMPKSKRLEVTIPAGVDNGSRVRMAGEGHPGTNGGKPGSLYLIVSVAPDERFERKGANLHTDVEVPISDAVLGSEVEVPTLTGKIALTIPPLSPNGKSFRLGGLGMPKLKGKDRGNLYARLQVKLPEKLSDEDKKLFEQLREAGN